jgi:hypothetical protein
VHALNTRCKRRDGAWVVEANENPRANPRAREGVERRRRSCGPAAPGSSNTFARTLTPRGRRAPLYVELQKRGTRKLRSTHLRRVELRDGWAADGTKKNAQPREVMMRAAHVSECSLRLSRARRSDRAARTVRNPPAIRFGACVQKQSGLAEGRVSSSAGIMRWVTGGANTQAGA